MRFNNWVFRSLFTARILGYQHGQATSIRGHCTLDIVKKILFQNHLFSWLSLRFPTTMIYEKESLEKRKMSWSRFFMHSKWHAFIPQILLWSRIWMQRRLIYAALVFRTISKSEQMVCIQVINIGVIIWGNH